METYYIVYKITNKINGRFYIGCHKTVNLDDGYMGSGLLIKRAVEKYGIENFEKEILAVFDNPEAMFLMESELVNPKDYISYNIKEGGKGGFDHIDNSGDNSWVHNPKHRAKFLKNQKKRVNSHHEKMKTDDEYRNMVIEKIKSSLKMYHSENVNSFKGRSHTDDAKRKIGEANRVKQRGRRNSQFGTMWITNGVENRKIGKDDSIPDEWERGRVCKHKTLYDRRCQAYL